MHYHPHQEERFEVLSGSVRMLVDGKEKLLGSGEVITIPPGTPHEMSADEAGVRMNWQTRPALQTETFLEAMWGLAGDGKTNSSGVPNLLQTAVLMAAYAEEFRLVSPPRFVQKAVFGALAPIGRLLGYRADYPYPHAGDRSRETSGVSG
ncbi:MAG: cupin domain-containing protein [Rubrobacter sp.]